MPVTSSNPTNIFPQFSRFSRNEKGEHYFIVHFDEFYTALFSHNTYTLTFYKNMAKKSAESYISPKGNDKAISILQNVIKVMVVLKKGRWSIKTWRDLMRHLSFFVFYFRCARSKKKLGN